MIGIFKIYFSFEVKMKLSTRSEYVFLALIALAKFKKDGFMNAETISKIQNIPYRYLEQLLLILKRSGYVMSSKGQKGGYKLAKSPKEISIAEIIRLFDGALAPLASVSEYFYETTSLEKEKKIIFLLKDIRDFISNKLEKTTLADIV